MGGCGVIGLRWQQLRQVAQGMVECGATPLSTLKVSKKVQAFP
jgi:hypothetical protein